MPAKSGSKPRGLDGVRHEFDPPLVPGRLIRRYKRFLADVELEGGETVLAHCPNSGSMLGLLEDEAPVYVSHQPKPGRRTAYTWELIKANGCWVGINTQLPNRLARMAAQMRALPLFTGATEVKSEVKVPPNSRLDLMVKGPWGDMFVEVKNVTLVEGNRAIFPDAVTARGAKHLQDLMKLKKDGARTAMLYLVQRADAESFAPADQIDPAYAELFHQARESGVEMNVVQARVSPQAVELWRELPLAV